MTAILVEQSPYQPNIDYYEDGQYWSVQYLNEFLCPETNMNPKMDFKDADHRYTFATHVLWKTSSCILEGTFVQALKRCELYVLSFFATLGQKLGIKGENNPALKRYVDIASWQIRHLRDINKLQHENPFFGSN